MENEELEKLKHDLRGPLTIVQSFFDEMELSKQFFELSESQRELMRLAKKSLERGFLLLNNSKHF